MKKRILPLLAALALLAGCTGQTAPSGTPAPTPAPAVSSAPAPTPAASGAPGPLGSASQRHALCHKAGEAAGRVKARQARKAAVHHQPHAFNGQ